MHLAVDGKVIAYASPQTPQVNSMHARLLIDALVIAAYFGAVLWVGLRFGSSERNLESFALANRSMPWWAVLASIIAAETSAATFLGMPGEGYELLNYSYLQMVLGMILGRVIVGFVFLKPFYENNVFSIYEYLEIRFGRLTRMAASSIFLATRLLASGARLYVAAIILAVGYTIATGAKPAASEQLIIYVSAIVVITVLTALYTTFGGIKAVVWTDCIQSSVMFGGACAAIGVLLFALSATPDFAHTLNQFLTAHNPCAITLAVSQASSLQANLASVFGTDYTLWAGLIGMTFATLATHGTDQDMVQRMLTAPDFQRSRRSLILSGLADLPIAFVFVSIGILLRLYFQTHCDPGVPSQTNEVFAYYILKDLPVVLRGILVAGIFATAMGSLSAALNALATSFTRDWLRRDESDPGAVTSVRVCTNLFAVLMVVVASLTAYFVIVHPESRIIPVVLGIFGYTYGSLLGVFLVGMLTRQRGDDRGNVLAMICGFLAVSVASGLPAQLWGHQAAAPEFVLAFPWRIAFGAIVTACVAMVFSTKKSG